jgi:peptidoglycan/LPS O-acetylase OafA/YrhL
LNYTMFQHFFGAMDINPVTWTLTVELAFYSLCIALFFIRKEVTIKDNVWIIISSLILGMALAVLRSFNVGHVPLVLPLGMAYMFLSAVWRKFLTQSEAITKSQMLALVSGVACAVILICKIGYGPAEWVRYTNCYLGALLVFGLTSTILPLRHRFLKWAGTISYSLYLSHHILGGIIIPPVVALFRPLWMASSAFSVVVLASCVGIALLTAWVVHLLVEKPFIQVSRPWIKRWTTPGPHSCDTGNRSHLERSRFLYSYQFHRVYTGYCMTCIKKLRVCLKSAMMGKIN